MNKAQWKTLLPVLASMKEAAEAIQQNGEKIQAITESLTQIVEFNINIKDINE